MMNQFVCGAVLIMYVAGCLLWYLNMTIEPQNRGRPWSRIKQVWEMLSTLAWENSRWAKAKATDAYGKKAMRVDREIFDSSVMLKNLAIAEKGRAFSADYIYEQLLYHSRRLQPVYGEMLSLYRSGRDEEAFAFFGEKCGTKAAKRFAMVLSKLDQIDPAELMEQMEVFQEVLSQKKMTEDMRRLQQTSALTTFLATAVVFAQLIDFTVVVVLLNTISVINGIF